MGSGSSRGQVDQSGAGRQVQGLHGMCSASCAHTCWARCPNLPGGLLPQGPRPVPSPTCQDYLPVALHPTFMAVVTEFLWLPWKEAMQHTVEGATQGGSQVGGQRIVAHVFSSGSADFSWIFRPAAVYEWLPLLQPPTTRVAHAPQAVKDAAESVEAQAHWLRSALPGYFTKKLLHQVCLAGLHCGVGG